MNVLGVTVFSGAACFVVEAATGDEPHDPWPIRIQTFVLRDYGTYELSFSSRCAFCLGTSRQCQETESRFTERIGNTHNIYVSDQGKLFFTRSCMLLLTLLQRCAPSFAQNRFVMYITHVHRYVCYVFHFVMYIISFLCCLGQSRACCY